jgi:hypothetical protein
MLPMLMFAVVPDLHPTFCGCYPYPGKRQGLSTNNSDGTYVHETYEKHLGGQDAAMVWDLVRPDQKSYKEGGVAQAAIQEVQ